jgi:hypothetical protein
MIDERWRPLPDWSGWYEVSDRGRVRSLDRIIYRRNGVPYRARGRILTPQQHPPSWVTTVTLSRAGHKHNASVHLLVKEAFNEKEKAA